MAKQNYCINKSVEVLGVYDLSHRYPGYDIKLDGSMNIVTVAEIIEEGHINHIEWSDILPNAYFEELAVDEHTMKAIDKEVNKIKDYAQVRQRLTVNQKDVLDITYQLGEKEFTLLFDTGYDETFTLDSPFDDVVKVAVDLMDELLTQERYYDFYVNFEDVYKVTKQDANLEVYDKNMQLMYYKVSKQFASLMLMGCMAGIGIDVILHLILQWPILQSIPFWITSVLPMAGTYIVKEKWYKFKPNNRKVFRISAIAGAFVVTIVVKLLTWIF